VSEISPFWMFEDGVTDPALFAELLAELEAGLGG